MNFGRGLRIFSVFFFSVVLFFSISFIFFGGGFVGGFLISDSLEGYVFGVGEFGSLNSSFGSNVSLVYVKENFKVEVGTPQEKDGFEIINWNETSFKLYMPFATTSLISLNANKSRITYENYDVDYFVKEGGDFEFDTILYSKPKSNVLSWTISLKDLDCYFQPPLDEERNNYTHCNATSCWKDNNFIYANRPENVVGSYACYHSSKRNNKYRTGKAFHIYRPQINDSTGSGVWGELHLSDTEMSIIIPQGFLDKAVYPVVVDPLFGNNVGGGSTWGLSTGFSLVNNFTTTTESGTVTSMTAYLFDNWYNNNVRLGWMNSSNGLMDTYINYSEDSGGSAGNGVTVWRTVSVSGELEAGTDYWLGVYAINTGTNPAYDSSSAHTFNVSESQGIFPSFPGDDWGNEERGYNIFSIYLNYTEGVGGDSCTCVAGENWEVDMGDFCVLEDACSPLAVTFVNSGNFTCENILNVTSMEGFESGQVGYLNSSCRIIDR